MAGLSLRTVMGWRSHAVVVGAAVAMGQFSDLFLFGMRVPLLPFLMRDHLNVPEAEVQDRVAVLLASFSISSFLCAVPAGLIADIPNLRSPLYLAGLLAMTAGTIVFYTSHEYAVLIITGALNGFSIAVLYAAGWPMIVDAVAPQNIGKAMGTIRSLVSVGQLCGPPVGGLIFSRWGFQGILNVSLGVLAIDFILRLFMVDKPRRPGAMSAVMPEGGSTNKNAGGIEEGTVAPKDIGDANGNGHEPTETDRLLPESSSPSRPSSSAVAEQQPTSDGDNATLTGEPGIGTEGETKKKPFILPILFCLSDPQLLVAIWLSLVQFIIFGAYDATLTIQAVTEFNLTAEQVGAVYLALSLPSLVLGPMAGWAVDRFGPRRIAITGYAIYGPALALMVLPSSGLLSGVAAFSFFCVSLLVQGCCVPLAQTPSMIKSMQRVNSAVRHNPARFGSRSAFGQTFGLNTLIASLGLMIGNYTGAALREAAGYWVMNSVLAAMCASGSLLAWTVFDSGES
ncbi:major facilitator superfamily domain-containing protein [Lasiosphaeria ovina]|uniref:Major facilitator superfamily domain-containing protein n=1 Tax=Lasiosphaeria ovina TaxID=92902 RepID=A0AAE0NJ74_9PEZI|nr:major facilitator superfamily domain-containing protein [Lasiosphaeria ovina]